MQLYEGISANGMSSMMSKCAEFVEKITEKAETRPNRG
jgi:hypothetical protein